MGRIDLAMRHSGEWRGLQGDQVGIDRYPCPRRYSRRLPHARRSERAVVRMRRRSISTRDPKGTGEFVSQNNGLACLCSNFIAQHPTDPNVLFSGLQEWHRADGVGADLDACQRWRWWLLLNQLEQAQPSARVHQRVGIAPRQVVHRTRGGRPCGASVGNDRNQLSACRTILQAQPAQTWWRSGLVSLCIYRITSRAIGSRRSPFLVGLRWVTHSHLHLPRQIVCSSGRRAAECFERIARKMHGRSRGSTTRPPRRSEYRALSPILRWTGPTRVAASMYVAFGDWDPSQGLAFQRDTLGSPQWHRRDRPP